MKQNRRYWLCQLMGWLGMVAIETINYTFFIVGKFSITQTIEFLAYALLGIGVTHFFRQLLNRKHFFKKSFAFIWPMAILATFGMAALMAVFTIAGSYFGNPAAWANPKMTKGFLFIYLLGNILNWMRYVGVWVIIYFMFKILQQHSLMREEKLSFENLAKTTELELLKLQLNPHFLFNALNSIKALVLLNPDQSRDAIVKLSELLRYTLQYGKEKRIPLGEEISEVKKYLSLEQLRFGERLSVNYRIAENTLSQTLPPALLLTLAENAVKHGTAKLEQESIISISTAIEGQSLAIQVINTGVYQPVNTTGIGLQHIRKRLEEIYHQQAYFTLTQDDDKVVATLQIPLSWP